jgi:hypothetical protein
VVRLVALPKAIDGNLDNAYSPMKVQLTGCWEAMPARSAARAALWAASGTALGDRAASGLPTSR